MGDQNKRPLFDALTKYSNSLVTPFDVPGHKMGEGIHKDFISFVGKKIFQMDVNSMKDLDNLSNPESVIKDAEVLAAELFHADNAYFIVNGSTAGVQNMILAAVQPGDKIIIPRNIHKSAINALVLSGANPVYVYPKISEEIGISYGSSVMDTIKVIDENPDAKAILLLHPTYYGFTNGLEEIIEYAHQKNMIVLVDESHGTHFYFSEDLPSGSMLLGADMATISVHKTGGSLTQSSILLHNNNRISANKVRSVINLTQTSSASYLLMASLDIARYNLATNKDLIQNVITLSIYAQNELDKIKNIRVIKNHIISDNEHYKHDPTKLLIDISALGKTGFEVYDLLKSKYNIQLEFGETLCVLAIVSIGDTKESIQKLIDAFQDLSRQNNGNSKIDVVPFKNAKTKIRMTPREAFFSLTEYINIKESIGKISADQIMVYPPGIPLLIPGEIISQDVISEYIRLIDYGNKVVGTVTNGSIMIKIIKE
jgi:arginine/lysine/ornithine decarboxylase